MSDAINPVADAIFAVSVVLVLVGVPFLLFGMIVSVGLLTTRRCVKSYGIEW